MTIEVDLPDGSVAEFPDGTSPDAMKGALARYKTKPATPPPGPQSMDEIEPNFGKQMLIGAGRSVHELTQGVRQMFGQTTPEEIADTKKYDTPLMNSVGGQLGNAVGDIAMTALPAAKVLKLSTALPKFKVAASLAGAGALNGAYEGMKPVQEGDTRAGNAAFGFGTGAAMQGVGNLIGKGISGLVQVSRAAKSLPKSVQDAATLGQIADRSTVGGKIASSVEEKARSIPIIGQAITAARERGANAWRDNVIDQVTPDGYTPAGGTMRERLADIQGEFSNRYKGALDGQQVGPLGAFERRITKITSDPTRGLTEAEQGEARRKIMDYYNYMHGIDPTAQVPNIPRNITATQAKEFERFLTAQGRQYSKSNSPSADNLANLFGDAEDAYTVAYRSQLPLSARKALAPLDQRYSPFKTVERAATAVGNDMGDFTPSQLLLASKARSRVPVFARGDGSMQKSADLGKHVFQDKLPNSGTIDRGLGIAALGSLAYDPMGTVGKLAGGSLLMLPAMTTKVGKNVMTGNTRAQILLQKLRADQAARIAGVPAAQAFDDLVNE